MEITKSIVEAQRLKKTHMKCMQGAINKFIYLQNSCMSLFSLFLQNP